MRSMLLVLVVVSGCMKLGGERCERTWWCEGSVVMQCTNVCDGGDKLETCEAHESVARDCTMVSTQLGVPKTCGIAQITVNGDPQGTCLDSPIEACPMVGAVACSPANPKLMRVCVGTQGDSRWDSQPFCTGAQHCQASGTGGISCVD